MSSGLDDSTLYIIIGAAAGAVVLAILIAVFLTRRSSRSKGASISGAAAAGGGRGVTPGFQANVYSKCAGVFDVPTCVCACLCVSVRVSVCLCAIVVAGWLVGLLPFCCVVFFFFFFFFFFLPHVPSVCSHLPSPPLFATSFACGRSVHELMAVKTLETTSRAPVAARATRQSSFYSSISQATSEI